MSLTLTAQGKQDMYRAIKERFKLKAAQRDKLDQHPNLEGILKLAYLEKWGVIRAILEANGII